MAYLMKDQKDHRNHLENIEQHNNEEKNHNEFKTIITSNVDTKNSDPYKRLLNSKSSKEITKKERKQWKCSFCAKIYHKRKPFERHLRDIHQQAQERIEDTFHCNICDKIFSLEQNLKRHQRKHLVDSGSSAVVDPVTKTTEQLFSPNKRNLVCDKCGRKFIGRTQLTDHVRSDCGRLPFYQCQECGKCLTTAGILKTHMLLHRNECPYQCEQCDKRFKVKAQYKSHIKYRHTKEKRFKCHVRS